MKLTTPYAVLAGFALVAFAIASQPLTGSFAPDAWAQNGLPVKVQICDAAGIRCAGIQSQTLGSLTAVYGLTTYPE